ncbi:MAG: TolC family protein [Geopsychrobacter sp.]|nr:TolC family protein [Geopsychrobacter sp.]
MLWHCRLFCLCFLSLAILLLGSPVSLRAESLDLQTALTRAARNHPLLKQMQQQLAASQQQQRAAGGDRLPQLQLQGSYQRLKEQPFERFNGTEFSVNDKTLAHYQLTLTQPLFSGFALSAHQQLADIGVDLARFDLQLAARRLQLQVELTYLDLLKQAEMLKVADETLGQLQNHLKDAQALFDEGMIPANDLLKAQVALASARQFRQRRLSRQRLSASRLALLVDRPLETKFQLKPVVLAGPVSDRLTVLIPKALAQRCEIIAARSAIAAAEAEVTLAKSRNLPQLNLVGAYQRAGNDFATSANPYRNLDNASIGLQLNWNLFAGGADRARSAAANHQVAARRAVLQQIEDRVKLEVEASLLDLELAGTNRQTAQTALAQARENQRLSVLQYQEQLIATSDLLDARQLLTRAETDLQNSIFGELQARARLDNSLGRDLLLAGGAP